uniref:Uncharacterized protein n=1 Tax=Timema cristinae TaxID=61476 RepID=A0A7R9D0R5_TIMCR|nr:unnamed protein product [Timema cristinae]
MFRVSEQVRLGQECPTVGNTSPRCAARLLRPVAAGGALSSADRGEANTCRRSVTVESRVLCDFIQPCRCVRESVCDVGVTATVGSYEGNPVQPWLQLDRYSTTVDINT